MNNHEQDESFEKNTQVCRERVELRNGAFTRIALLVRQPTKSLPPSHSSVKCTYRSELFKRTGS